ncbi:MAG: hypothetical protein HKN71_09695, partial [Gemmatimonadetes bacterium]|nr:hypothetical protein [Gemmatimonadota bacterium]
MPIPARPPRTCAHLRPGGLLVALALVVSGLFGTLPAAAQTPVAVPPDAPARYHPLPSVRAQAEEMQGWVEA